MPSVLQPWVQDHLSMMQQSVLLTAIRGPDGIRKDHVAKLVVRWLRRCVLLSAFDKCVIDNPYEQSGGSFTGPSIEYMQNANGHDFFWMGGQPLSTHSRWEGAMAEVFSAYIHASDELPAHFQSHIKNAAEVLGYMHPDHVIAGSWFDFYKRLVNEMHANRETYAQMMYRLGDNREQWLQTADPATADSIKGRTVRASDIGADPRKLAPQTSNFRGELHQYSVPVAADAGPPPKRSDGAVLIDALEKACACGKKACEGHSVNEGIWDPPELRNRDATMRALEASADERKNMFDRQSNTEKGD